MFELVIHFFTTGICKYVFMHTANDQIVNIATVNKQSESNNVVRKPKPNSFKGITSNMVICIISRRGGSAVG